MTAMSIEAKISLLFMGFSFEEKVTYIMIQGGNDRCEPRAHIVVFIPRLWEKSAFKCLIKWENVVGSGDGLRGEVL